MDQLYCESAHFQPPFDLRAKVKDIALTGKIKIPLTKLLPFTQVIG